MSNKNERLALIQIALGKAFALFTGQPGLAADIVMPTEELLEIAKQISDAVEPEIAELEADIFHSNRWRHQQKRDGMWAAWVWNGRDTENQTASLETDGTDAGLRAAIRKARKGMDDGVLK